MGRILLYGSATVILAIASWYYYQGEKAPDALIPIVVLLLAVTSFGYGIKAEEDGDYGKIERDKTPRVFKAALYFNHFVTGALVILGIYLFAT